MSGLNVGQHTRDSRRCQESSCLHKIHAGARSAGLSSGCHSCRFLIQVLEVAFLAELAILACPRSVEPTRLLASWRGNSAAVAGRTRRRRRFPCRAVGLRTRIAFVSCLAALVAFAGEGSRSVAGIVGTFIAATSFLLAFLALFTSFLSLSFALATTLISAFI